MTGGIGAETFGGNKSIVEFTATATNLTGYVFNGCASLKKVVLPNATLLRSAVFNRCYALETVILGAIESFVGDVFYACTMLKTLVILNTTPPSLGSDVFAQASTTFIIYVPDASIEAYRTASGWSAFADRIKAISLLPNENLELYEEIKEYLVGGYVANLFIVPQSKSTSQNTLTLTTYYLGEIVTPEYSVDSDIAEVIDGVLTFNDYGTVTVTATYNGESAGATYTYNEYFVLTQNDISESDYAKYPIAEGRWVWYAPIDPTKEFICTVSVHTDSPIRSAIHIKNKKEWASGIYDSGWINPNNQKSCTNEVNTTGQKYLGIGFANVSGSNAVTIDLIKQYVTIEIIYKL